MGSAALLANTNMLAKITHVLHCAHLLSLKKSSTNQAIWFGNAHTANTIVITIDIFSTFSESFI